MSGIGLCVDPWRYRIAVGMILALMAAPASPQKTAVAATPASADVACASSGSAASVVASSAQAGRGTQLLQASYETQDWSGDLESFPVSTGAEHDCASGNAPAGAPCPAPSWSAASRLQAQNWDSGRTILTYSRAARAGIPFRYASLDAGQIAQLKTSPAEAAAPDVVNRVAYLRGDTTQDGAAATPRDRHGHVLGDIVDSAPVFVGAPAGTYSDPTYAAFRGSSLYRTRIPMAYVAANDGMLHAFDAGSGATAGSEKFAYVPNAAFGVGTRQPLLGLTQVPFKHAPIVDGTLQVADARINNAWATVLVGGLGQGGRAVYALDVSNPAAITENSAGKVLWEFSNQDDGDLGDTEGTPSIVKMKNGRWAAIFGNGYSTPADPTASGKACLFIAFLEGPTASGWGTSGGRYQKICTRVGETTSPNGLASPAAVDVDRNPDEAVDFIYAGDERGNLWRFDVKDANPANWKVGYGGNPLFTAKDAADNPQPITEQPEVGYNLNAAGATNAADPKLAIYFGTGRYRHFTADAGDNALKGVQTFYGIFDSNLTATSNTAPSPATTRAHLLKQSIVQTVDAGGHPCSAAEHAAGCLRITTQNVLAATDRGWFIDLQDAGGSAAAPADAASKTGSERQVSTPVLRDGRILFTTLIPPDAPCGAGGGWLMALDARSGGRPRSPVFDTGGDRRVNQDDAIRLDGAKIVASGSRSNVGMPAAPAVVNLGDAAGTGIIQISGTGRDGRTTDSLAMSPGVRSGRITWREIQQ